MYGLIVIGDDLASHVAAATASVQGIKTALIAENGIAADSIIGDLAFNTDPTPFTGVGDHQILSSLSYELGILPKITSLNPAYQIILPEKRIDFFSDKDDLTRELIREFPELANEIKSFYDEIEKNSIVAESWLNGHPFIQPNNSKDFLDFLKLVPHWIKSILDNVKFKKVIAQNPCFQKMMEAQRALLSFQGNHPNSLFSDYICGTPLRGVYYFPQGKHIFYNDLIRKLDAADGLYLKNQPILSVKKGRIIEVTYKDDNGVAAKIESENLIVSTKWQNMHLILDRKKKFNFGDFVRPAKIARVPFTLHLGIKPQCLPEKMARHVAVVCDVHKDIYDDNNLILLESGGSQNENAVTLSRVPLSVTVFLPDQPEIWAENNLEKRADAIINNLDNFFPFLRENIELFDIHESINISQKQRNVVNPKYNIRNSFLSGFAAKSYKTRFGNIYLTGASLLADAGFEGEMISGNNAVKQLSSKRE
jgi:phytoene dehydrogenase-like protein